MPTFQGESFLGWANERQWPASGLTHPATVGRLLPHSVSLVYANMYLFLSVDFEGERGESVQRHCSVVMYACTIGMFVVGLLLVRLLVLAVVLR